MMDTVSVTLLRHEQEGVDSFGMPVYGDVEEVVEGCLVCPSSTSDLAEDRPEGADVRWEVIWPNTFEGSIKGCRVVIPGISDEPFDVVGDPLPVPINCPTDWNRVSEVGHVLG